MRTVWKRWTGRGAQFARRFGRADSANVVMLVGLLTLPMFAGAGLAIDSARAFVVENRLGKALDAAGLAAGRVVMEDRMEADARAFFAANYPDGLLGSDLSADDVDIQVDSNDEFITVRATTQMPTRFMRVFGQDHVEVAATSVIQRLTQGAEIALVMDNTGSMSAYEMSSMKGAAADLVEIVFGEEDSYDHLWWSLVPYTATVNVGDQHIDWLKPTTEARDDDEDWYWPTNWKGCVEARWQTDRDETDDPPSIERFESYFYPSTVPYPHPAEGNEWSWSEGVNESQSAGNSGYGPNLGCGPAITPLTNQKQEVLDAIDEMASWSRGGTASNFGLVWGWRTLSPRWRGLWDGSSRPEDYDNEEMNKVAIVLTDGVNQFYDCVEHGGGCDPREDDQFVSDYTAYGRLGLPGGFIPDADDEGDGLETLDNKFASVCSDMKEEGITIYTITFGSSAEGWEIQNLFRTCASDPGNYFHAPDNAQLAEAFRAIGQELSNLRIVE